MQKLVQRWKLILGLFLLLIAFFLIKGKYLPGKEEFESEKTLLETTVTALENTIAENRKYSSIRDQIPAKEAEIEASRASLYDAFPNELKEEDQILYILYLEKVFGNEISFTFSQPEQIASLSDGTTLNGQTFTVNYESTYKGFKKLVNYLSTDTRVASVQYATLDYDSETDAATGTITITLYSLQNDAFEYVAPSIAVPSVGKDNIFK